MTGEVVYPGDSRPTGHVWLHRVDGRDRISVRGAIVDAVNTYDWNIAAWAICVAR